MHAAGPQAVLGGLTAAGPDGLTGFDDRTIHLLVPAGRQVRTTVPGVMVHRSRVLGADDVHPARRPPRTRLTRSLLDAAAWRRWLDAYWEEARLVVEVDGLWHMEVAAWWADMRRDNDLTISGLRVLRFPAFAVRDQPGMVAAQIRSALDGGRVARA